jgi:CelD/BcsL family acetyltransferase involved in cellulose biosynthesis
LGRAFSKDARKKLRYKTKKLNDLGPIAHRVARSAEDVDLILGAFLDHKRLRFREMGVANPFESAATQAFLHRASQAGLEEGWPALELHALSIDDRIVAVFGGAVDAVRCSGMFVSFDQRPEIARFSPGEVLLAEVVRHQCSRGRRVFDLGVGEARYKASLCPEVEPLVDVTIAVTARGRLLAATASALLRAKGTVKRTPWLWTTLGRLRTLRARAG